MQAEANKPEERKKVQTAMVPNVKIFKQGLFESNKTFELRVGNWLKASTLKLEQPMPGKAFSLPFGRTCLVMIYMTKIPFVQ